jgi:hypothetical protein
LKQFSSKVTGAEKEEQRKVLSSFLGFLSETSGYYVSLIEKIQGTFQLSFNGSEAFLYRGK